MSEYDPGEDIENADWYHEDMDEEDIMIEMCYQLMVEEEEQRNNHERKYGVPDWLREVITELNINNKSNDRKTNLTPAHYLASPLT